jgi:hypothetical protein
MSSNILIWKIFVNTGDIRYECAQCEWAAEYTYPFGHNQKKVEKTLSIHQKTHKSN